MSEIKSVEIDWNEVWEISRLGKLDVYLKSLPKSQWIDRDPRNGFSFLHYSFKSRNNLNAMKMLLTLKDFNINTVRTDIASKITPLTEACAAGNVKYVELICTRQEANVRESLSTIFIYSWNNTNVNKCVLVLIANGARLEDVENQQDINKGMVLFQQRVLRCRDVIVTLLGLKKQRRVPMLTKLDRFLLRHVLAVEIWTTRKDPVWTE